MVSFHLIQRGMQIFFVGFRRLITTKTYTPKNKFGIKTITEYYKKICNK